MSKVKKETIEAKGFAIQIYTEDFKNDYIKEMLLVDDVDNKEFLTGLFNSMYDELPAPKPKKKK